MAAVVRPPPSTLPSRVLRRPWGQFDENTHVVLYSDLNETTRLGDGFVKNGSVSINIGNYQGPYVAVIDGSDPLNTGVGFYDEASHQRQLLGARQLRALNPDSTQNQGIGVTVLTELAVKYYKTHYGSALAANNIKFANAVVQAAIKSAPPLLTPPTLVGEGMAPNSLDWNGSSQEKYALILAALAQAENSSSSGSKTAANLIDDMGTDSDLAADKINLPADLSQPLQTAAATYANTATQLQMATATFATANNTSSSTSGSGLVTVSLQPANVAVTTDTDVGLAKQLFSDLRTAKLAVNNNSATAPGFYQTAGQNIIHDTHTNIRNHGAHLIDATFAMEQGTELLHNVATGNTSQYGAPTSRYDASTGTYIPSYVEDNHRSYCYVDVPAGITAASMTAVMTPVWQDLTLRLHPRWEADASLPHSPLAFKVRVVGTQGTMFPQAGVAYRFGRSWQLETLYDFRFQTLGFTVSSPWLSLGIRSQNWLSPGQSRAYGLSGQLFRRF